LPFEPGKSGNPNGRPPRDLVLSDLARKRVNEEVFIEDAGGNKIKTTAKEAIIQRVIQMAMAGDKWAINQLWDRLEGQATQFIVGDMTDSGQEEKQDVLDKLNALEQAVKSSKRKLRAKPNKSSGSK
jgi:hypothetical protein